MCVVGRIIDGFLRWARHDRGAQPGIGCEHVVKTDQMQARTRHQRGQALHEFQRRHLDVRGAVTPGAFELQHDIACAIALEPFVGDRGAGDIAAQAFEFLALMPAAAHPGVQAEAVRIDSQARRGLLVPAGETPMRLRRGVSSLIPNPSPSGRRERRAPRPSGDVYQEGRRLSTFCPARGPSAMR